MVIDTVLCVCVVGMVIDIVLCVCVVGMVIDTVCVYQGTNYIPELHFK